MALFLYMVIAVVGLIGFVYFDVKGIKYFNFPPRAEADSIDREMRPVFGTIGVALWPLGIGLLLLIATYRGLLYVFNRVPKEPKLWGCPMIKPATGYRDPIQHCAVMAKSVKRPKCGVHHCNMEEKT